MARTIDIDTEKLLDEISKLEKTKESIKSIFDKSSKENKNLNDSWSSDTSKTVNEEFEKFDDAAEKYINVLEEEINYLKDKVSESYIEYEATENNLIDEKIATD